VMPEADLRRPSPVCFEEAALLRELLTLDESVLPGLLLVDLVILWKKKRKILYYRRSCGNCSGKPRTGRKIFVLGAGTSYHAALTAAYFFNNTGKVG